MRRFGSGKLLRRKALHGPRQALQRDLKGLDAGTESDATVQREFATFQNSKPGNEPLHVEWVRKFPKSRAAHLALGYYYQSHGFAARGDEFANKTSREQFAAMEDLFRQAMVELDAADALGKTSLTAAKRVAMAPASADPSQPGCDEPLPRDDQGLSENASIASIRRVSAPKWGGSMRKLASIIDDAKGLPPADKRYIEYLVYRRWPTPTPAPRTSRRSAAKPGKRRNTTRRASPLCPGLDVSLRYLIALYSRMEDIPNLMRTSTLMIERHPRSG